MSVEVTYQAEWRRSIWDDDVPSRQAWFVTCPDHPHLGRSSDGEPWGYTTSGRAWSVATRHTREQHANSTDASQNRKDTP